MSIPKKAYILIEPLILVAIVVIAVSFLVQQGFMAKQASQNQLDNIAKQTKTLDAYFDKYGAFPESLDGNNCPEVPVKDNEFCLENLADTKVVYQTQSKSPQSYVIYVENNNKVFTATDTIAPFETKLSSACPAGFVPVPGNPAFGTSDFCTMKYEAKCAEDSSNVGLLEPVNRDRTYDNLTTECIKSNSRRVVSSANGAPIALVEYSKANEYSKEACEGCRMMNEAEWMTIMDNILKVPSNWMSGEVGSGHMYVGHTNNSPRYALEASLDDNLVYKGTGSNSTPTNQRRTLVLSNGYTIWDFVGNVWEWTQPAELQDEISLLTKPTSQTLPWYSLYSIGSYSSDMLPSGVGVTGGYSEKNVSPQSQIFNGQYIDTVGFVRGGFWGTGDCRGMRLPFVNNAPPGFYTGIGFRVTR